MVTSAPAITAPLASVTWPETCAVSVCANAMEASNKTTRTASKCFMVVPSIEANDTALQQLCNPNFASQYVTPRICAVMVQMATPALNQITLASLEPLTLRGANSRIRRYA